MSFLPRDAMLARYMP